MPRRSWTTGSVFCRLQKKMQLEEHLIELRLAAETGFARRSLWPKASARWRGRARWSS